MIRVLTGDCREVLKTLPADSVHCSVTSPPYFGLRDYGAAGQIGLEQTPEAYVAELVSVFREVRRVLRPDGTLWLNLGDSYANDGKSGGSSGGKHVSALHGNDGPGRGKRQTGLKPKDLIGIPWMVAFALRVDGWYLRRDIIWHKPNPMPESVTDRCTTAHEYIFHMSKSERYFYDAEAIKEDAIYSGLANQDASGFKDPRSFNGKHKEGFRSKGRKRGIPPRHEGYDSSDQSGLDALGRGAGRNKRSVWTVATVPFSGAHFATFPPALIEPCILAGCPKGGMVLDPFGGAGTTGMVADRLRRDALLIELNPAYATMARERIHNDAPLFRPVDTKDSADSVGAREGW